MNHVVVIHKFGGVANQRIMLRAIGTFCISLICFSVVTSSSLFNRSVAEPLSAHLAQMVNLIVSSLQMKAAMSGTILISGDFGINIVPACTGIPLAIILVSATLAFPSRVSIKLSIIGISLAVLYFANLLRLSILFVLGLHRPELFDFVHVYIGQPSMMLLMAAAWLLLTDKFIPTKNRI